MKNNDIAKSIEQQFGEIVDIIKLIGDIAEETNLLSLNASIEE